MARKPVSSLLSHLDLSGGNVMEIMIGVENTESRYTEAIEDVKKNIEPLIWNHLKSLNLKETLETKQTVEELHEIDIQLQPDGFAKQLAEKIDSFDFNIAGKSYLFGLWLTSFNNSAVAYVQELMRIRTEIIMRKKVQPAKSRLILP